jgi:hypothetical protein
MFVAITMFIGFAFNTARAQTFNTLYTFTGAPDGGNPFGGLLADGKGNYFGTTSGGGISNNGTVFELSPPAVSGEVWTETIIWDFAGGADGSDPSFQLVKDAKGNLYGETRGGGNPTCSCGTVFVIVPPKTTGGIWAKHIIYLPSAFFPGQGGGLWGLTIDSTGILYGIRTAGGIYDGGLAYKLVPAVGEGGYEATVIYYFGVTSTDSMTPSSSLAMDASGNLYGVSSFGGADNFGTAYKLTPPSTGSGLWSNTVLHSFTTGSDGCFPLVLNVVLDKLGRLYGQSSQCGGPAANGTFFRLTPPTGSGGWTESILYTFGSADGGGQYASLSLDAKTNSFYGTSFYGTPVVYQLTPPAGGAGAWTDTVLHTFTGGTDGSSPSGPLVWDSDGVLYGTTNSGADGYGTIFSIIP